MDIEFENIEDDWLNITAYEPWHCTRTGAYMFICLSADIWSSREM
jgi:hypothetical protein